jgi:hypothetical protein
MGNCRHHVATEYGESRGAAAYRALPSLPCQSGRLQRPNSGIATGSRPSQLLGISEFRIILLAFARWRCFKYEELLERDKLSLDLFLIKDKSLTDTDSLPPPDIIAAEIADDLEAARAWLRHRTVFQWRLYR